MAIIEPSRPWPRRSCETDELGCGARFSPAQSLLESAIVSSPQRVTVSAGPYIPAETERAGRTRLHLGRLRLPLRHNPAPVGLYFSGYVMLGTRPPRYLAAPIPDRASAGLILPDATALHGFACRAQADDPDIRVRTVSLIRAIT